MILSSRETIDADKGDEIYIKMLNLSRNNSVIKEEKRIWKKVIPRHKKPERESIEDPLEADWRKGGFGHIEKE